MRQTDQFRTWLNEQLEKLPPGSKLPADADLAGMWNCAKITIGRILREYEQKNKVVRVWGKGTYIPGDTIAHDEPLPVKKSTSETVYSEILSQICRGELKRGDALPSQKQICLQFGVTSSTVRRSYDTLAKKNLITRAGKSWYVGRFGEIIRASKKKAIVLFSHESFDLRRLYIEDMYAPSFRKMENELLAFGYAIRYEHYERLGELIHKWILKKIFPMD